MQPATPLGGGRRNSRRTVLLGVLVLIAIVVGLFLILRGSGSSKNASKPTAVAGTVVRGTPVHGTPVRTRVAAKPTSVPGKKTHTPVHVYAAALLPYVQKSSRLFNQTAKATSEAGSPTQLGDICGVYEPKVEAGKTEFDGVPHPYPWWYKVGHIHAQVASVYNDMLGALTACITAAESDDASAAATSVHDINDGARRMRATVRQIAFLKSRP